MRSVWFHVSLIMCQQIVDHNCLLLPASVELFDRTELIEQLLIDEPRREQELVVRHELVNNLLFHSFCL